MCHLISTLSVCVTPCITGVTCICDAYCGEDILARTCLVTKKLWSISFDIWCTYRYMFVFCNLYRGKDLKRMSFKLYIHKLNSNMFENFSHITSPFFRFLVSVPTCTSASHSRVCRIYNYIYSICDNHVTGYDTYDSTHIIWLSFFSLKLFQKWSILFKINVHTFTLWYIYIR